MKKILLISTFGLLLSFFPLAAEKANAQTAGNTEEAETTEFTTGANCYIAPEKGKYAFQPLRVSGKAIEIASADWLWATKQTEEETEQRLLEEVCYKDGKIRVTTTGEEGNAIIGGFDKEGKIVWIWQIWCTDQPDAMEHENGSVFMDRLLGATSADPADGKQTWGLVWQWGRNVPLFAGYDQTEWEEEDVFTEARRWTLLNPKYNLRWRSIQRGVSIEESLANPTIFYWNNGSSSVDWHNEVNLELWSETRKTDYDPCPPGYKVPTCAQWTDLEDLVIADDLSGATYTYNGKSGWWPASGSGREYNTGCNIIGEGLFMWSSSFKEMSDFSGPTGYYFPARAILQYSTDLNWYDAIGNNSFAHFIRCVSDNSSPNAIDRTKAGSRPSIRQEGNQLTASFERNAFDRVVLTDVAGKTVRTERIAKGKAEVRIQTEGMAKGIYILTLTGKGKSVAQKVVIR